MLRNVILLITFIVAGLCFAVIYLATYEDYERLLQAKPKAGKIVKISEKGVLYEVPGPLRTGDGGREPSMEYIIKDVSDDFRATLPCHFH